MTPDEEAELRAELAKLREENLALRLAILKAIEEHARFAGATD